MRHPVIVTIGWFLMGLVLAGLALTVVGAALSKKAFYGVNAYGLDLGTYSTLAVLGVMLIVGVVWVAQRGLRAIRRKRSSAAHDR